MPQPDGPPTPPNPISALGKATGIGADPRGLSDLQQNMKMGVMPLAPWAGAIPGAGILAGLKSLISPAAEAAPSALETAANSIRVVHPQPVPQVPISNSDADALEGLLKYGLAKAPNAAPKMVSTGEAMGTSAQGANDMLHPSALNMMDKMYQQANPVFKGLQDAGAFAGNRLTNTIGLK